MTSNAGNRASGPPRGKRSWFRKVAAKFEASHTILGYGAARSFVLDTMAEGKRKHIIYMLFEADITEVRNLLRTIKERRGQSPSLSAYVLRCFAKAVDEQKEMQAYRLGRHKLVVFDAVDVAVMVEKEACGQIQPLPYLLRAANAKHLQHVRDEIERVKNSSYEEMVPRLNRLFFERVPKMLRRCFWFVHRRSPKLGKFFSGTVGFTAIGMFGEGKCHLFPITPRTTTMAVGATYTRPAIVEGAIVPRDFLCLTLCVDHDIVDGARMMRFTTRVKTILESGFELADFLASPA
jgi:pyruvate/2-oxoglutarate dehydrogenase complex dihydrolipoamide acyltransferase (E2) component